MRGDLVQVARARGPTAAQRVVLVARDDVDVEMEDGLPGGRAAGIEDVEAVRLAASRCIRSASRRAASIVRSRSSSGISSRSAECSRGITSAWPAVAGLMSMKATVCSSESTISAGSSPATIAQKMQSRGRRDRRAAYLCSLVRRASATASSAVSTSPVNTRGLDLAPSRRRARGPARSRAAAASSSPRDRGASAGRRDARRAPPGAPPGRARGAPRSSRRSRSVRYRARRAGRRPSAG